MTEEEAKTKWCPFARFVQTAAASTGEIVGDEQPWNRRHYTNAAGKSEHCMTHCMGSACMAWRWRSEVGTSMMHTADKMIRREDGAVEFWPQAPEGDGWHQQWTDPKDKANRPTPGTTAWAKRMSHTDRVVWGSAREGFCGLAGKP